MRWCFARLAVLLGAISLSFMGQHSALGVRTASRQLSFGGLMIVPGGGTFVLLTNWTGSAFAQAGADSQFNSGGGSTTANATGDFSLAHGQISTPPVGFNVNGQGNASANVPGQVDASDTGTARGSGSSIFVITGGSGPVLTSFSINVSGSINAFTDIYWQSSEAEIV